MDARYHAKSASRGQAVRDRIRFLGRTLSGATLWSEWEDQIVRTHYPDYIELCRVLKGRSHSAIKCRASHLDVANRNHTWTSPEITKLCRLYRSGATRDVIENEFPWANWKNLANIARINGAHRRTRPLASSGVAVIDDIRKRARSLNITMKELDAMSSGQGFFYYSRWLQNTRKYSVIARAVRALGGQLRAEWLDDE